MHLIKHVKWLSVSLFSGVMKALRCPFLTRLPLGQVKQQATELLSLADRCPIMGHVIKYTSMAKEGPGEKGTSNRARWARFGQGQRQLLGMSDLPC